MITDPKNLLLWQRKPGRNSFENNNWDTTVIVTGKERCGMSTSALRMAKYLGKNSNR